MGWGFDVKETNFKYKKRRDPRPPKNVCERRHAMRRAWERHGLRLNWDDLGNLAKEIQTRSVNIIMVEKQTCSRTFFVVEKWGKKLPLIYDTLRHEVMTFLDKDVLVSGVRDRIHM